MRHLRSIRRVALGAAVAGATIGAVPAMASAATTCSYSASAGGVVTVNADPKVHDMALSVVGKIIAVRTDATPETLCFGSGTFGMSTNTNRIQVFHKHAPGFISVDYRVDLSRGDYASNAGATPESDGNSELETTIFTDAPAASHLTLIGTPQRDVITLGGDTQTDVNFGSDRDVDFTITGRSDVKVSAGDGDDFISANGDPFDGSPGPFSGPTKLAGHAGNDVIFGGSGPDSIVGGHGSDSIRTAGGGIDEVYGFGVPGGPPSSFDEPEGAADVDDAIVDFADTPITGIEKLTKVGRLRLAPAALKAEAGKTARLKMSWMHPKSWRQLRNVKLSLYRGTKAVGMINARPASARLSSTGGVDLMSGSKLSHHGKWVTAKLALRLSERLAGATLRVDVTAVDTHGHEHVERDAGVIHVAK
jgi:RTX calcium-binding nonapeptide repeat (4 copies)